MANRVDQLNKQDITSILTLADANAHQKTHAANSLPELVVLITRRIVYNTYRV